MTAISVGRAESARLSALSSYDILDSGPEAAFDDIVAIAARLCDVPTALVSLVDGERQWFKAKIGVAADETGRDIAFCAHAIHQDGVMVVPDATRDPRFADNPLVTGDPGIRFYAGAPIVDSEGYALGTVCVIDHQPREAFDGGETLAALARQVATQLELRRRIARDRGNVAAAENYRDLLWSRALDVMVVTDIDGRIVDANPAWTTMFGRTETISDAYAPSEREPLVVPEVGEDGVRIQRKMMTLAGTEATIAWTLARKHDLVFRIGRDQTRAVRAEEQLAHIQKMESLGQLTGGIAHDFNNLLTIILGNIETATRRVQTGDIAAVTRVLGHARDASERAAALTQRLLAFARRQSLDPVEVNAITLVRDLSPLLERTLGTGHRVAFRYDDAVRPIRIDPAQLENAIINLVVNARDAMPDGGTILLSVENAASDGEIAHDVEGACPAGDFVRIAVRDTGTGMAAATRERVFEPFFTTKEEGKGTGLGLSQVMGFVSQSGGRVAIETALGNGTEIALWLPVDMPSDAAEPGDGDAAQSADDAKPVRDVPCILLVEDNDRLRDHVGELLEEAGYFIVEAVDGEAARVVLSSGGCVPDFVLSDIRMPHLDGFQLSAEVRAMLPHVPILLMTGYAGGDPPPHARHDAILTKPFTAGKLLSLVEKMLKRVSA